MEQFTILPIFSPLIILFIIIFKPQSKAILPNNWQLVDESLFRTILLMLVNNVGINKLYFFPLIYTIFHLIFISNYIGLIPYSATASTEIIITLSLAFTLLIGIFFFGIFHHNLLYLVHIFLPAGTPVGLLPLMIPLEILAYLTRTLSLGLRLAVNIITGHILVKVCLGFLSILPKNIILLSLPIIFIVLFLALEVLIAYLQAYIFVFITIITLRDII
jgi:F-type H+-transporting ATPase subunit a